MTDLTIPECLKDWTYTCLGEYDRFEKDGWTLTRTPLMYGDQWTVAYGDYINGSAEDALQTIKSLLLAGPLNWDKLTK